MIFAESRNHVRRMKIECLKENISRMRVWRDNVMDNRRKFISWPEIVKSIEKEIAKCQKKLNALETLISFEEDS